MDSKVAENTCVLIRRALPRGLPIAAAEGYLLILLIGPHQII